MSMLVYGSPIRLPSAQDLIELFLDCLVILMKEIWFM